MRPTRIAFLIPILILVFACGKKNQTCELDPDILDQDIDLSITRLEDEFFGANTVKDYLFLLEKHPEFAEVYLQESMYFSPDSLAASLLEVHQDSALRVLYDSVKVEFADISDIETDLKNAFKSIKYYFPDFKIPKVYTFVSGFNSDLIVTDDMIVIGLDYYLPADHSFQPDIARYMAVRYEREYLVPMIVLAISSRYNITDPTNNTLLSEMMYYGKAYHFVKAIMPCTSDQFIIGYTPEEIAECFENEEFIWAHFVENELLYQTNPFEIRKYIGEAPFTDAISTKAPGRLGRWLGWNIVDDYQSNQNVDLAVLMMEWDVEKIFRQSGYRPRRPE
ncbi:gliding motility-associated lipoprotein GldB [Algoriphagus alkaliphilus]|uniref:Gliding motility-associated lipoprotein GldB n=1 Tax=Algoriphagus alkaliphilus TaxID=279824 RepID=A0A1G5UYG5_9BACT|nr:gliding motility lipoprotein GldB [Algoriphagus alkaliphilus]MBA4300762.1 gliding motility lipoprotein GldB [Cyclobacterium sp.]SDA38166.1 gliding motility-associated lipoprotein GldB [Algoriphagus alkaliphilus]